MTKFDLFDSIGNVDDELIEKAIEPKKSSKKAFLAITSVAACAVFACGSVLIVQNMNKSNNVVVDSGASSAIDTSSVKPFNENSPENGAVGGASSEASVLEDGSDEIKNESSETVYEQIPVEMYKIKDGELVHSKLILDADPQKVFVVWKSENDIGEEVKLVNVRLEDNGTDTVSKYSGTEVVTHTKGDRTALTITVTSNLEDYCEIEDYYCYRSRELVLESLEKTMLSMCDPEPDEYHLVLADQESVEESESNYIAPEDIQYNDQGEALE